MPLTDLALRRLLLRMCRHLRYGARATAASALLYGRAAEALAGDAVAGTVLLAATCALLGGKAEEQARRPQDVVAVAQRLASGAASVDLSAAKTRLLVCEHVVLRALRFDVDTGPRTHAHTLLLRCARDVGATAPVVREAAAWVHDALLSRDAAALPPVDAAAAALFLASRGGLSPRWWRSFGVSDAALEAACGVLLEGAEAAREAAREAVDAAAASPVPAGERPAVLDLEQSGPQRDLLGGEALGSFAR